MYKKYLELDDILSRMVFNRFKLNADKTELIWCSSLRRLQQLQAILLGVDQKSSYLLLLSMILAYTLMLIFQCGLTLNGRWRVTLLLFVRFVVFVGHCHLLRYGNANVIC